MKQVKQAIIKIAGLMASFALVLGVTTATSACSWWYHQPKLPEGMDKFKK